ncbi:DENN domain-containing protein 1C [Eublepharis macularius]|uniref:DENN domain-containing protein 1C n=1 Tax=Eublepharis macularius TaxID=481883 RepID=A0AA97KQP8_EUBMA|nr:DENN domain-containing protein 1C [Eublepharis macularius]
MGSRIRENPQKIFDLFFEAACPASADYDSQVLRQFPLEFDDQESIQILPKFCFPFDVERVKETPAVQHFTFALTDLEGKQRFGFCRLAKGFRTCLCVLSYLPWFEVFYKILNYIADNLAKEQFTELDEFLSMLYLHPVPKFNSPISLEFDPKMTKLKITTGKDMNTQHQDRSQNLDPGSALSAYFIAPDHSKLPTIPENRNLTEFVVAVDVNNMLQLYACLLHERRILLTSSKLSTLTACVQASSTMLYPMHWQHIYIPALPSHLLDYCCAPMPYLIGVHTSLMERVRSKALEDVVILNIDNNTLESPFQDLENLPSDVISLLKYQLKKQSASTGDGVARAFLRAQALLFGSYREALVYDPGQPISFCQESFLKHGSSSTQTFLQRAVHLQLFKQFIDDRLEKLNAGEDFSDLFEQEISRSLSPGNMHSYQLWVKNLKKGGGALISTVKNKANPAVRNVYQYAKGQAKMGLRNMRSHLLEKDSSMDQEQHKGSALHYDQISSPIQPTRNSQSESLQSRLPITQHFGKSRPRRPQRQNSTSELQAQSTALPKSPLEHDTFTLGGEDLQPGFLDPGGLDLLGEIFETLSFLEPSQAGRPLYGTRSLDFSSLEEGNFYTKLRPSEETLHETLSEEQDENSSLEDTMPLTSLEQENMQGSLLPSTTAVSGGNGLWGHDPNKTQDSLDQEKAAIPLEEEEERARATSDPELSQVARTHSANTEASTLRENETAFCTAVEAGVQSGMGHTFAPFPATPLPEADPPTPRGSSTQSAATPFKATPGFLEEEAALTVGKITSPHHPLVSRTLTQARVSELKKRFEA